MRVIKYVCIVVLLQYALMAVSFTEAQALSWPRTLKHEKGTLTFYQPQFERWGDEVIEGQAAMVIQLHGSSSPLYGGIWLKADTDVSLMDNLVQLSNIQISNIRLPAVEPQAAENAREVINDTLAGQTQILSLGRILPAFLNKIDAEWVKTIQPNLDPPHIWVSLEPAVLLTLEGEEPILQPIADTGLQTVLNTNMDAFYYPESDIYYLFTGEQWLSFNAQADEWKTVTTLPEVFKQIPDDHEHAYIKDVLDVTSDETVKVFMSPMPAELILIDEQPNLEAIDGTSLFYVTNTSQHLFFHKHEKLWYAMFSGRWFRTKNFQDSWVAATADLPKDFQKIPLNHPKSIVLFSVPGTNIAKELVLQAQIPQRIKVKRDISAAATYQGEPHFVPIPNTPVRYAVNTRNDVFQIKNTYYLCFEGIWFSSDRPDGNWKIFTAVPEEIYAIPETHPKYYVTFVKVYDSKAKTATFGFTSGYMGLYATNIGTVVYGTGYYYPSYVNHDGGTTYYYPNPSTYRAWPHQYNLLRAKTLDRYSPDIYGYYTYYYSVYASNYQDQDSFKQLSQLFEELRTPYDYWGDAVVSRSGDWVEGVDKAELQRAESQVSEVQEQDNNVYLSKDGKIFRHNENGWASYENGTWVPYFSDQLPSLPENERNTQMDGYIAALKRQRGSEPAPPPPTTPYQITPPATSARSTSRRAPAAAPSQPVQVNVNVQDTQQSRGYYYGPKPPHQLVITPTAVPFGSTVKREIVPGALVPDSNI